MFEKIEMFLLHLKFFIFLTFYTNQARVFNMIEHYASSRGRHNASVTFHGVHWNPAWSDLWPVRA
jgi:hypothetical protein